MRDQWFCLDLSRAEKRQAASTITHAFSPHPGRAHIAQHKFPHVNCHGLVRVANQGKPTAAHCHIDGLLYRCLAAGTFHHQVRTDPIGFAITTLTGSSLVRIHNDIGANFFAYIKPAITFAARITFFAPRAFTNCTAIKPIGPAPKTATVSPPSRPPTLSRAK